MFEEQVGECQKILFYEVSEETLTARCQERAKTSGRDDDNLKTLLERFRTFAKETMPVVDFYDVQGKVQRITASGTVKQVYAMTKKALLPEVFCIVGPRGSGKTRLGEALAERANMEMLNFNDFLKTRSLTNASDEDKTQALISFMVGAIQPRYLLEDFPQNDLQARYFVLNCTTPKDIFALICSKDVC
jgi:adenylate kinase family enzyme